MGDIDEHKITLIDDIDNNGYLMYVEKEIEQTNTSYECFDSSLIGKRFHDSDVAYHFYNEYNISRGFGIRKHQLHKSKVTKEIYRRVFVCNKEGYKDMNDKRRARDGVIRRWIKRTGCKAMLQVSMSKYGDWVVDKYHDEHNHPLDPPTQVLKQWSHNPFHRSDECKDIVTLLSKAGMKPCDITKIINAFRGNQEDKITRAQCSSIVSVDRKINVGRECHEIIMHFQEKAQIDKDFYFVMDLSPDGTFKNLFWADGRSRSSYNQFGDVVVFDVTYKTNIFSLPFAPFVGVNHHNQSILFGVGLLENENEATFTWLLKHFLKCMHECPPISIITDQDLAMSKAIANVFPKTRHRYCAWHIDKHVLEHLQPLRSRYDDFEDTYARWVKSESIEEFESGWGKLKEKYHIEDASWLGKMYQLRHMWVRTYLKDTFFAGMTTSGRSESIHSFFDGFVNSKTRLNDFVVQYDKAVTSRRGAEEDQNFRTSNSKPTLDSDHPIEAMAAECYTRNVYEIFKKEWKASSDCGHAKLSKDVDSVNYHVGFLKGNKENWKVVNCKVASEFLATCSCAKFETFGILCKHILYIMKRKLLTSIPNYYILPRWTMKASYTVGCIGTGLKRTNNDATKEVSFITLWSIRAKVNKVLEEVKDSPVETEKFDRFLNGFLEEQNRRKIARVELDFEVSPTTTNNEQRERFEHICVSDPKQPVKTKGRPKIATQIKSGMEKAADSKKRNTCGYCKGKGHNITGCQKKKMDNAQNDNTIEESEM